MYQLSTLKTMSSREISTMTNKRHSDVIRSIKNMEQSWINVSGRNFTLASYIDNQGKPRPEYILTKTECLYVATKFNDEARAKLIMRWEELESQNLKPNLESITKKENMLLAN